MNQWSTSARYTRSCSINQWSTSTRYTRSCSIYSELNHKKCFRGLSVRSQYWIYTLNFCFTRYFIGLNSGVWVGCCVFMSFIMGFTPNHMMWLYHSIIVAPIKHVTLIKNLDSSDIGNHMIKLHLSSNSFPESNLPSIFSRHTWSDHVTNDLQSTNYFSPLIC